MWTSLSKWLLVILPFAILIALFLLKGKIEYYAAGMIKETINPGESSAMNYKIDSLYNYTRNGLKYRVTLLEFGAKGCVACRKMEFVLDEVRKEYPEEVKVEFLNILKPENQALMKHFGIIAIPTQVLLETEGHEFFRHTGYLSFKDLSSEINFALDQEKRLSK